jgi:hypothetical protein
MRYSPEVAQLRIDLTEMGDVVPLEAIASFIPPTSTDTRDETVLERSIPVLQGREIEANGRVHPLVARRFAAPSEAGRLRAGDLCVRRGISPADERLAVAEIDASMLPIAADDSVICLRLDVDEPVRSLVVDFLRSRRVMRLLRTHANQFSVDQRELAALEIPFPGPVLTGALADLLRAEQFARSLLEETKAVRRSLVDSLDEPADVLLLRLFRDGRLIRQRVHAAEAMTDVRTRLRQRLPFPLAHGWRAVDSAGNDLEAYVQALELAENATTYLAALAVAAARFASLPLHAIDQLRDRLAQGRSLGFGDWSTVIEEVEGQAFRRVSTDRLPLPEALDCLAPNSQAAEALIRLRERRNDQAHGRGPKGGDIERALEHARADLLAVLASLEFLGDYPLRYVEHTRWDSLDGCNLYVYRDLMGDHSIVGLATGTTDRNDLEEGSLYVVGAGEELVLLRPLVTRKRCTCGAESIFILESVSETGRVVMRSLVDGHRIEEMASAQVIAALGLVPPVVAAS